jgi:hypothetical protein
MVSYTNDIWSPLDEQKWRELAEGTGASALQLKFAAARFGGAGATAAARLAGYSGDKDSLRRAGYSAVRSRAVQSLLELASVAAPEDARISDREIDAKLARLIRNGDPNVVIKAAELHQKRETLRNEAQRAAEQATDPREILAEIAKHDAVRAATLAIEHNLPVPNPDAAVAALRAWECRSCAERLARKLGVQLEPDGENA